MARRYGFQRSSPSSTTTLATSTSPRCLAVEVASHGDTQEEALANLREALELYFEDSPVPEVDVNPELASVDVRIPA